jgi:chromosome segregation ATPase
MIAQSKNDKQLLEYFDPDKMVLNEQISDLEGQLTSLQDRLKQAEEKAESESLKNFQLFKQLKAVEDAKSESDQRVDNLTVQLLASHEINEKQTQTIQQLEIALQQAQQRIQEVQLQSEEANSEAVKALESQHARANIFQNEVRNWLHGPATPSLTHFVIS